MQFEYDPERLIEEVKKRPGIWDMESIDYRITKKRRKLWTEVVNELNANTREASKSELRVLELQLQKKWKSLRDCFIKYVQNPNRTKRPYIYVKQLQFLMKDCRLVHKVDSSDSEYERSKLKWKRKRRIFTAKVDPMDMSDDNEKDVDDNETEYQDNNEDYEVHVPIVSPKKCSDEEFAFANVDATAVKRETDDPDKLFLISLLPHLKTIPDEFRLKVKMELMQVLQNANFSTAKEHKIL